MGNEAETSSRKAETSSYSLLHRVGLIAGPLAFLLIYLFFRPEGLPYEAVAALASTSWIAIWWITEAIPIPVTSLLPIILFPALGIAKVPQATAPYAEPTIFLFLGGFLIAVAIERWNLHRRIALGIISFVGTSPSRLVLGFMLSTAFLSAFLSNTATAMMMLPIGLAVISQISALSASGGDAAAAQAHLEAQGGEVPKTNFGAALMLGIAYAASIGGVATLIGTPPNAVFAGVAAKTLGVQIGFAQWALFGAPVAVIFLFLTWFLLLKMLPPEVKDIPGGKELIRSQLQELGPMQREERRVMVVFVMTSLLWILRPFVLKQFLPLIDDAAIAVFGGVLLFLVPTGRKKGTFLLGPDALQHIPWGILLLFGAGFSVAGTFQSTGLAKWIASGLTGLHSIGLFGAIIAVTTLMIFLTEITSNTAVATLFMPIMASMGSALGVNPIGLMAVAATAASFAFMLPVATPPNAIVYSTGYMTIPQMAKVGFWLNLAGIVVIGVMGYFWLPIAWGL